MKLFQLFFVLFYTGLNAQLIGITPIELVIDQHLYEKASNKKIHFSIDGVFGEDSFYVNINDDFSIRGQLKNHKGASNFKFTDNEKGIYIEGEFTNKDFVNREVLEIFNVETYESIISTYKCYKPIPSGIWKINNNLSIVFEDAKNLSNTPKIIPIHIQFPTFEGEKPISIFLVNAENIKKDSFFIDSLDIGFLVKGKIIDYRGAVNVEILNMRNKYTIIGECSISNDIYVDENGIEFYSAINTGIWKFYNEKKEEFDQSDYTHYRAMNIRN